MQNIRDRLKNEVSQLSKLEKAIQLKKTIERQILEVGELSKLSEMQEVNITLVMSLDKAGRTIDALKSLSSLAAQVKEAQSLPEIDLDEYYDIYNAYLRSIKIAEDIEQSKNYIALNSLSEISVTELSNLQKGMSLLEEIKGDSVKLSKIDLGNAPDISDTDITVYSKAFKALGLVSRNTQLLNAKVQIDTYCDAVVKWLKDIGVATETCPKCGETIIIDLDKLEKS